jgi:hypothetical protein
MKRLDPARGGDVAPALFAMVFGMIELARLLHLPRSTRSCTRWRTTRTQHAINFCDDTDETVSAKELALRGSPDESAERIVADPEPDMIEVRIEVPTPKPASWSSANAAPPGAIQPQADCRPAGWWCRCRKATRCGWRFPN